MTGGHACGLIRLHLYFLLIAGSIQKQIVQCREEGSAPCCSRHRGAKPPSAALISSVFLQILFQSLLPDNHIPSIQSSCIGYPPQGAINKMLGCLPHSITPPDSQISTDSVFLFSLLTEVNHICIHCPLPGFQRVYKMHQLVP